MAKFDLDGTGGRAIAITASIAVVLLWFVPAFSAQR
jgi:hypothetical protein